MKKRLIDKLFILFPEGMLYKEAIEISKALFCSADWLPDVLENELSLENICEVFALLSSKGFIFLDDSDNNQHNFEFSSTTHWINIIRNSLNSSNNFYDENLVKKRLTRNKNS